MTSGQIIMSPSGLVGMSQKGMRLRSLLAATVFLPLGTMGAWAQTAPAAPEASAPAAEAKPDSRLDAKAGAKPAANPNDAVKVLLQQADYWRGQYQPAQAVDAYNRVLQIDSHNADALAGLTQVEMDRGRVDAARNALSRLKVTSPADTRIPTLETAVKVGAIDPDQLQQARSLAQQGRAKDAVGQYQHLFKGNAPPSGLATEYYSVLSGTDKGWDQARQGLGDQVTANPQDMHAQLAYAQLLTYRESTRAEGIKRLSQLAANASTATEATTALRQALMWLPANASSISQLETYVKRHPEDSEMVQRLEAARHPTASPGDEAGQMRVEGYEALNRGRYDQAAARFEAVIDRNASDADAVAGLGLVRLRQGRRAEAQRLLERAIALNPARKRQWQAALSGAESNGDNVGRQWDEVRRLADRGEYTSAESKLRSLIGPTQANTGGLLLLADIQQRANELGEAEVSYRTVLNRQPTNSAAIIGLAGVLSHQGRTSEADQLYARAESMGARGVGQMRAQQLRQRAEEVTDPIAQAGLYRAAIAVDSSNPWLKLELARVLVKQNRVAEARAVMSGVGEEPKASEESVRAALIFANEINDSTTASALIARIPAKARTPDMQQAIARAETQTAIASASQLYYINRPLARERLLALAAMPDQNGVHGAEVAREFLRLGDKLGAREAISTAMSTTRRISSEARLAYSSVLLEAGQTDAAAAVAAPAANAPDLSASQRESVIQLQAGIAVRAADRLSQQGRTADAYDRLAPVLARAPTNPDLNMALSRLYASNNQPKEALAISEALLRQDPSNMDVRRSAVGAAIQANQYDRAQRLVQDALQIAPGDPQVWIMSADLAKARGNSARALHDYQVARDLRRQQLSGDMAMENATLGGTVSSSVPSQRPLAPAPNILTAPILPSTPSVPAPTGGPVSLEPPRRGQRSSERQASPYDPESQARSETTGEGSLEEAQADDAGVGLVQQAEDMLPKAELAQALLPYYVSPAPVLSNTGVPGDDVSASDVPALPAPGGGGYGGLPFPYATAPAQGYGNGNAAVYGGAVNNAPVYPSTGGYSGGTGPYVNPFRAPPPPDMVPQTVPSALGGLSYAPPPTPEQSDQLTQDINRNIASLRDEVAPKVQAGFGIRVRSGDSGLGRLTEEFVPLEATYSPGAGQLKLQVTPVFLQAGSVSTDPTNMARFGSLALYGLSSRTPNPGSQSAGGVGLDVAYNWEWFTIDVGSTPVGFREQNVIGGIELAPKLTDHLVLRMTGERRGVTDSLLAYAGMQDNRTGQTWGGVTRNRGHAQLEYGGANGLNLYGGGGFAALEGDNVQSNTEWEAGLGGSYPVYRAPGEEVRVGLDLVYFGYAKNLNYYTLGQGGYFSPQSYFAALIPVTYRQTVGDLTWSIGGSVGFQTFHSKSSDIFPGDINGMQTQLMALAATNSQILTSYAGQNTSGFAGGAQADVEYKLTPSIAIGGRAGFQHTGNFTEGGVLGYARYAFGVE